MSFLDSLFGGAAKKRDIAAANQRATEALATGRSNAISALQASQQGARDDISSGYDAAASAINAGMSGARRDLGEGFDQARSDVSGQYNNAIGAVGAGMDRARGVLNPMLQLGAGYDRMYADAMGLNGADARTAFYDRNVRGNTDFAYADDLAAKQLQSQLNARGITGGRAGALMLRQGAQRVEDRTNQYLDRMAAQGQRGAQIAGQLAGLEAGAGAQTAGIYQGLGDRQASLGTQRGSAMADLGMRGNSVLAQQSIARGDALGNLGMGTAGRIADIETGYGNSSASNAINYGNAMAAQRGSGLNNMLQLAGLGIRGLTPGVTGATPFGNMARGVSSMWAPSVGKWQTTVSRP